MGNQKESQGAAGAQGQQKSHEATRVNPETQATETKSFTQEEWRNRDKSEGWTRPEGDAAEADSGKESE